MQPNKMTLSKKRSFFLTSFSMKYLKNANLRKIIMKSILASKMRKRRLISQS